MFGSSRRLVATKGNISKARRDRRISRILFLTSVIVIVFGLLEFGVLSLPYHTSNNNVRGGTNDSSTQQESFQPQECAAGLWNPDTHTLEINPNCPASPSLMQMQPPATDKKLTFFLIYFNDHHHLSHQLQTWIDYGSQIYDQIQFVIVDDSSAPGHMAAEFLQANEVLASALDIVVYRIEQNLMWNIGGARNLGFWMANTPWILMTDTDTLVPTETLKYILGKVESGMISESPPVYTFFQRIRDSGFKPHPAVMLIRKQDYWKVGGCDEDFVGSYGWTDPHFRYKVQEDPTLEAIKAHHEMDEFGIPPLREMNDDIECPSKIVCLERFHGQKAIKEPEKNEAKFKKKSSEGEWSNEVLRYTWHRVKWQKSWWGSLFFWSSS